MDAISADLALQAVLGRGAAGDFVGGIDNEALDFSQLEAFINSSDGGQGGNGGYFGESLVPPPSTGKLLNVIVENKRVPGHSLPESPPDSSSEHPYSPQDPETIYTTLGQPTLYKPGLLNPIISDNLILGSHIVVSSDNPEPLLENGSIIMNESAPTNLLLEGDRQPNNEFLTYNHPPICEPTLDAVYTNLQSAPKKRKLSQDVPLVKSEPETTTKIQEQQLSPPGGQLSTTTTTIDEDYAASETCLSESQYQCIRFQPFLQNNWHVLCDQNLTELPIPHYRVDADKGFNFSNADDAFVCQKKNHFQITCHVQLLGDAQFVKTAEGFQKISSFHLHFYGVKHDCPTQTIRVEQSQSDRSKKPFHPVLVELVNSQVTKVTVGRLHFSETTSNNMRKKGKPNPEQRYFQLVVGLHAHTTQGNFPIVSHASQKIIVRASNPGQFESDVELCWQKGQTQDSVYHAGKVGINTDRPDESLVVHGNLKLTGHIIQPSDVRAKKNIVECDTAQQLRNVQRLRVVRYEYDPIFASQLNRTSESSDTGVIAQEVAQILPEAVSPAGDVLLDNGTSIDNFLVVNKERIFMENIGAVKELCKVTDNLETRIDQLERINRRLSKLKRGDSLKSNSTVSSTKANNSSNKCFKHHCRSSKQTTELCSNKFIQIIIVVLVLIMAFCLAAITTLYLMETAKFNRQYYGQVTLQAYQPTKRPQNTKTPTNKLRLYQNTIAYNKQPTGDVTKITLDVTRMLRKPSDIIGRPPECAAVEQDLENTNLCQVYCCVGQVDAPRELETTFKQNKSELLHDISKGFHTNDIEKQGAGRQKRDAINLPAIFGTLDDHMFAIVVQGRNFNATLTSDYLLPNTNNKNNITYAIPISKYMPDDYVNLIFKPIKSNYIKEIEHCYNYNKKMECVSGEIQTKIDEKRAFQNADGVVFEVGMLGFHMKFMTYRMSLRQNQNICKLSPSKLGNEFVEYNFNFYRLCDD